MLCSVAQRAARRRHCSDVVGERQLVEHEAQHVRRQLEEPALRRGAPRRASCRHREARRAAAVNSQHTPLALVPGADQMSRASSSSPPCATPRRRIQMATARATTCSWCGSPRHGRGATSPNIKARVAFVTRGAPTASPTNWHAPCCDVPTRRCRHLRRAAAARRARRRSCQSASTCRGAARRLANAATRGGAWAGSRQTRSGVESSPRPMLESRCASALVAAAAAARRRRRAAAADSRAAAAPSAVVRSASRAGAQQLAAVLQARRGGAVLHGGAATSISASLARGWCARRALAAVLRR